MVRKRSTSSLIEVKGDIWEFHSEGNPIAVTTNPIINTRGKVVMGRGIAKEAATRFPRLPAELAMKIQSNKTANRPHNIVYYFPEYNIFTFPTKHHWRYDSNTELIKHSYLRLRRLVAKLRKEKRLPSSLKVYIPRPGCGNGRLDWSTEVKPILENEVCKDIIVVYK